MKNITKVVIVTFTVIIVFNLLSCGIFSKSDNAYMKTYLKAHEFMLNNQPQDAIPLYFETIKQKDDFSQAYNELAVCYSQIGKVDSSIFYYHEAIKYDSSNVDAYQSIGNIYFLRNDFSNALFWYERSAKIDNLYPRTYNNIATIYYMRGNYTKAREYYNMAITVDATYPRAYYGLGLLAFLQEDYIQAETRFLDAVRVGEMPEAMYMLGQLYFQKRDFGNAIPWLQRYIEKNPTGEWAAKANETLRKMGVR